MSCLQLHERNVIEELFELNVCVCVSQMQEIVTKFGMVVIARSDTNPSKFIYESDFLSKNKVFIVQLLGKYSLNLSTLVSIRNSQ